MAGAGCAFAQTEAEHLQGSKVKELSALRVAALTTSGVPLGDSGETPALPARALRRGGVGCRLVAQPGQVHASGALGLGVSAAVDTCSCAWRPRAGISRSLCPPQPGPSDWPGPGLWGDPGMLSLTSGQSPPRPAPTRQRIHAAPGSGPGSGGGPGACSAGPQVGAGG